MKKLILTERQVKLISLIKEGVEFQDQIKIKAKDIKKSLNAVYSLISFTTIAEFRDGDIDLLVAEERVKKINDMTTNLERKVSDYFDRFDEDTYDSENLSEIQNDLEDTLSIIYKKGVALDRIITHLKPFSKVDEYGDGKELDWDSVFNDIDTREI